MARTAIDFADLDLSPIDGPQNLTVDSRPSFLNSSGRTSAGAVNGSATLPVCAERSSGGYVPESNSQPQGRAVFRDRNTVEHEAISEASPSVIVIEDDDQRVEETCRDNALRGVIVSVESACCQSAGNVLRDRLSRMGAEVVEEYSTRVTHIIWGSSNAACATNTATQRRSLLDTLLAMDVNERPHLLVPQWVDECWAKAMRRSEELYSLYGARFLLDAVKKQHAARVSAAAESGGVPQPESSSESENTGSFSALNGEQLLQRITKLSRRLDNCYLAVNHGRECPSRLSHGGDGRRDVAVNTSDARKKSSSRGKSSRPRFRRTIGGIALAQLAPSKGVVDAWQRERNSRHPRNYARLPIDTTSDEDEENVSPSRQLRRPTIDKLATSTKNSDPVQDLLKQVDRLQVGPSGRRVFYDAMTKSVNDNLNDVRQKLRQNVQLQLQRTPRSQQVRRSGRMPNGRKRPIVVTASRKLNEWQMESADSSDDDGQGARVERTKKSAKKSVVCSGLTAESVAAARRLLKKLGLSMIDAVDDKTSCLIMQDEGDPWNIAHTLVLRIPVVTKQWLVDSVRARQLLSHRPYLEPVTKRRARQRRSAGAAAMRRLFAALGPVHVAADHIDAPINTLLNLLESGNADIVTDPHEAYVILCDRRPSCCDETAFNPDVMNNDDNTPHVPPVLVRTRYVADCILRSELVLYNSYELHTDDEDGLGSQPRHHNQRQPTSRRQLRSPATNNFLSDDSD